MNAITKRLTFADLRRAARKHGATIDETSKPYGCVNVDTPTGLVWGANGLHTLCVDAGSIHAHVGPIVWHEAVKDAMERMSYGLTKCTDTECEWCHESA